MSNTYSAVPQLAVRGLCVAPQVFRAFFKLFFISTTGKSAIFIEEICIPTHNLREVIVYKCEQGSKLFCFS
jgi:hypothetical protein